MPWERLDNERIKESLLSVINLNIKICSKNQANVLGSGITIFYLAIEKE